MSNCHEADTEIKMIKTSSNLFDGLGLEHPEIYDFVAKNLVRIEDSVYEKINLINKNIDRLEILLLSMKQTLNLTLEENINNIHDRINNINDACNEAKNMNFENAVKMLIQGKKITRNSNYGHVIAMSLNEIFTVNDVLAKDWEIVR